MLTALQGLILKTVKYSETSIICDIYTREFGLRTYIVGGVRKTNSKISPGLIRPMNWVDIIAYHRDDKEINRIKEVKASILYQNIPFNVVRGSIALFMTEIVQKTVREAIRNEELFDFLLLSYTLLDSWEGKLGNFHLSFFVKITFFLGLMPEYQFFNPNEELIIYFDCKEGIFTNEKPIHNDYFCPEISLLFLSFIKKSTEECSEIKITKAIKQRFVDNMINYLRLHIEHLQIHSHEILHQVLS